MITAVPQGLMIGLCGAVGLISNVQTDTLVFYIYHNNVSQKVEMAVYIVTRNCAKTQNTHVFKSTRKVIVNNRLSDSKRL